MWMSAPGPLEHSRPLASNEELLAAYPTEPRYHAINKDFPGLTAVHREPWIFEVPKFVNTAEAQHLLAFMDNRTGPVGLDSRGTVRQGWDLVQKAFDARKMARGWRRGSRG